MILMNAENDPKKRIRLWRNWLSFAGGVLAIAALFAFLLLLAIDLLDDSGNPYLGILAYVIAPGFLFLGLGMIAGGIWLQRRHQRRTSRIAGIVPSVLSIDVSQPADRRKLQVFALASVIFLLCTAIGSYQTYQVSES